MFSHFFNHSKSSGHRRTQSFAGFSLVELLVSISIITIVVSIILIRQSTFNSAVLLRGQAYEVALQMREVQLTAVGVSNDGSDNFRSVLGVYFNSNSAVNGQYTIFREDPSASDGFPDPAELYGIQGILDPRFEIRAIRLVGASETTVDEVSILYVRPNFDARFVDAPGNIRDDITRVEVDVARKDATGTDIGVVRTVEITSTGQIAVQ